MLAERLRSVPLHSVLSQQPSRQYSQLLLCHTPTCEIIQEVCFICIVVYSIFLLRQFTLRSASTSCEKRIWFVTLIRVVVTKRVHMTYITFQKVPSIYIYFYDLSKLTLGNDVQMTVMYVTVMDLNIKLLFITFL